MLNLFAIIRRRDTPTRHLVQCRENPSLAVFQTLNKPPCFVTWKKNKQGRFEVNLEAGEGKPLTLEAHRRLRELSITHHTHWITVEGGMLMVTIAYQNGVRGRALPDPVRKDSADQGGTLV